MNYSISQKYVKLKLHAKTQKTNKKLYFAENNMFNTFNVFFLKGDFTVYYCKFTILIIRNQNQNVQQKLLGFINT